MRSLVPSHTNGMENGSALASPARNYAWGPNRLIDSLLTDFLNTSQQPMTRTDGAPLDLIDLEDAIRVSVEVPGIDPNDLEVSLTGQILSLAAEKRDENEEHAKHRTYSERQFGAFKRSIKLPCAVDPDAVKAEHKHGVITVTLQKSGAVRPRRIQVEVA